MGDKQNLSSITYPKGDVGPGGIPGDSGAQGHAGNDGIVGSAGPNGSPGERGADGKSGDKGDKVGVFPFLIDIFSQNLPKWPPFQLI